MSKYTYATQGTCSTLINIEIERGVIRNVSFEGGCNGNLQGISKLVTGMSCDTVIAKLKGIRCGCKTTSCPDQLASALTAIMQQTTHSHDE